MMGEYDAGYEKCIDSMVRQMEDMQFRIDSLHRENDKLREQIHWLKQGDILHVLTDQEYIDQCERERLMQVSIDALDKENAKLRELVRDMAAEMRGLGVDFKRVGWCDYADRMRELGVDA